MLKVCYIWSCLQVLNRLLRLCVWQILFKKSMARKAVCVQMKPLMHTLANKVMTEINLGHHTSYVNIAVVL